VVKLFISTVLDSLETKAANPPQITYAAAPGPAVATAVFTLFAAKTPEALKLTANTVTRTSKKTFLTKFTILPPMSFRTVVHPLKIYRAKNIIIG
jgi:hypothetical protein